jgi:hypothetical protein
MPSESTFRAVALANVALWGLSLSLLTANWVLAALGLAAVTMLELKPVFPHGVSRNGSWPCRGRSRPHPRPSSPRGEREAFLLISPLRERSRE